MSDTTPPGLAYLRASAEHWFAPQSGVVGAAVLMDAAHEAWVQAGCPTDLAPQADLDRARDERDELGRMVDRLRATVARYQAEDNAARLAARVAACDAEILRLEAENRRLTRGVRGWVRAWLGAR